LYIESGYKQGLRRSWQEMRNVEGDADIPQRIGLRTRAGLIGSQEDAINAAFFGPVHADRAAFAFTRTFEALRGITTDIDKVISRELAQGLVDGKGPVAIAKAITDELDDFSKKRALTIARTEVMRAHNTALISSYRAAGVEGVAVEAEWQTAQDNRVCPRCSKLEGHVFALDVIERLLPLHPNCRCVAIPKLNIEGEPDMVKMEDVEELLGEAV
jgi:SPP1 gp7 family putative phage head morphogenesis protein